MKAKGASWISVDHEALASAEAILLWCAISGGLPAYSCYCFCHLTPSREALKPPTREIPFARQLLVLVVAPETAAVAHLDETVFPPSLQ